MIHNLAYNMRPTTIDDIVGQQHLLGTNKIIRRMVNAKRISSMILYGPPGIGKTSIASALSGSTNIPFEYFNSSTDDKKKLQGFGKKIEENGKPLIIFIDEIHRMDKAKKEFLLPFMESGEMIIIGATTENPYINIPPAIRSRAQIFQLEPVQPKDIKLAINRALNDNTNGLGKYPIELDDQAKDFLSYITNGDVRSALNALELAALSTPKQNNKITLTTEIIEECTQRKAIDGDASGDAHYNTISALQKSIRGSDADASLHYLSRILESGDLNIAMRRLMITAFEDIGIADPTVWTAVMSAITAADKIGLPEARIPLANATVLMALSNKSNAAYKALDLATHDLSSNNDISIPPHLKDAHYKGANALGHGIEYKYPHDYPYSIVAQQYLPNSLKDKQYLKLNDHSSFERKLHVNHDYIKKINNEKE